MPFGKRPQFLFTRFVMMVCRLTVHLLDGIFDSAVPMGLGAFGLRGPRVETRGYFLSSLREVAFPGEFSAFFRVNRLHAGLHAGTCYKFPGSV